MVTSNNYVSDLEFSELAESDSEWVDGLYSALGYHDYGYSLPRDTPEQIHGSVDRVIFSGNSPLTVDEKIRNRPCSDMLFVRFW